MRDVPAPSKLGIALCSATLLMLALLTYASAPASAATSRPLLRTLSTGPGSSPHALASDDAGNVYVLEIGGSTPGIAKFDPAGNPVPFSASGSYIKGNKLTGAPGKPYVFEGLYLPGVAVDRSGGPNDGYIYVSNSYSNPEVFVYDSTGAYKGALDAVQSHVVLCSLAINQSNGAVYTNSYGDELARRFAAPTGNPADAVPNGRLDLPGHCGPLAVDSTGAAYASVDGVTKFDASQFATTPPTGTVVDPDTPTGLAVDPGNDDLFIDKGDRIVQRTAAGTQVGSAFPTTPLQSAGIAIGQSGELYVSEENGGDGGVFVFGPDDVDLSLATTSAPSNVEHNSADIAGEADPDGAGDITGCEFRYGRDAGYSEGSVPCTPAASTGSPITSPTPVSASLTGLQAGTHYHYRLFVENANGTTMGADQSFDTPAAIEGLATGDATEVTKDSAELGGSYIGNGEETHYYFQYGTTTSYGQTAPTPPGADAGSGSGPQSLAPIAISGLQGGTEYHYRVVVGNQFGTTFGEDRTFTTAPAITNLNTDAATAITSEAADLNGSFDADKYDVHYYFEYGPTTDYGQVAPALPGNEVPSTTGNVKVPPVSISGLQPGATYHFRIVATNAAGKSLGADEVLTTADRPAISNLSTRNVKASSAELTAAINPQGGGTSYHFEYGPTTDYGTAVPIPDEDIGSGRSDVNVSSLIEGLSSGVTYHFRVVAQNPYGNAASPDQTFGFYPPACPNSRLRQETGSNNLPECRAYELASPGDTGGTTLFPKGGPTTPYATSPAHIAFVGDLGRIPGSGDPINTSGDLYVATRTSTGWYTKYIGLAANETLEMGGPPQNWRSREGPSSAQRGVLSSPTMDRILNYNEGTTDNYPTEGVQPSNAPYVWDSSTNTQVARWPTNLAEVDHGVEFVGSPTASADLTHFVFSSDTVFASGGEAVTIPRTDANFNAPCCAAPIYDNNTVTGTVKHISVKEDGTTNFIGIPLKVSDDGNYIVMSEGAAPFVRQVRDEVDPEIIRNTYPQSPLFVWSGPAGHTYDIAPGHSVHFEGATADGKTVYISSPDQLTADDHDSSKDLFMWQASDPQALTRISVGSSGEAGNSDACSVSWIGGCGILGITNQWFAGLENGQAGNGITDSPVASKSGDIYFESPEQLDGAKGEFGQVNLYVYREGEVRYVTKMSNTPLCIQMKYSAVIRCSGSPVARIQVTPDGRYAGFITRSRVTSYDNAGKAEMYRYSADTGQVICVSCLPSGQPPTADVYGSQNGLFLIDDGRMGFSTDDALVSRDTDEGNDTYEYVEGRPQLISSGLAPPHNYNGGYDEGSTTSGLIGMSANGVDFYFASYDHLVTQDHNGQEIKIYDARTNGGFPAEVPRPDCQAADECHGPGSTPPPPMADRTSASQGVPARAKAKKHAKKHQKKARHQKKKRAKHQKQKRAAKNRSGR